MARNSIKVAKRVQDLPRGYVPVLMAELAKQNDRAVAIVGASYLDLMLRWAIELKMVTADEVPRLFEDRGPLQEFSSRINVGFALGIYKRRAFNDLKIIRDIRNAFAHSAEHMDFYHQDVANSCHSLWYAKKIHKKGEPAPTDPRGLYIRAVEWLIDGLFMEASRNTPPIPRPFFLHFDVLAQQSASPGKSPRQRPTRDRTHTQSDQEPEDPPQSSRP